MKKLILGLVATFMLLNFSGCTEKKAVDNGIAKTPEEAVVKFLRNAVKGNRDIATKYIGSNADSGMISSVVRSVKNDIMEKI